MSHRYWLITALPPVTIATSICRAQVGPNPFANSAQTVEDGRKLFAVSCAPCHGRNGEGGQSQAEGVRPPDLTRGVFKAGRQDADLFRVITDGVPGTEMAPFRSLGDDQIWRLVSFIRSLHRTGEQALGGNPGVGEALFWGKGDCGRCHEIGQRGTRFGPDLTRGGRRSDAKALKKSIVDPDDDISPGFAVITVVTRDNKKISGLQRWLDNFSTRLVDESGVERTFLRDEVLSVKREFRSLMPAGYGKSFTDTELNDLVAYILKNRSEATSR